MIVTLPLSILVALLPAVLGAPHKLAPLKRSTAPAAPDSYIVAIRPNTVTPTREGRAAWLNRVLGDTEILTSSLRLGWDERLFNGVGGTFTAEQVETLRTLDETAWIEPNIIMSVSEVVQQPTGAPWGLARVSSGPINLAGLDPLGQNFPYFGDDSEGQGTDLYVLDTGIRETHVEFGGRATFLGTFGPGVPGQDLNGHGTHCAGTAAGATVGIAKKANIFGIKVFGDDGSGNIGDIISGIDLAFQTIQQRGNPSVISMSLGGPVAQALDDTVAAGIQVGLSFVIAAGNESQDANNVSPARVAEAITVGASDINDNVAFFSNFGDKIDVFAPGDTVISAGFQADDALDVLSGTSMAAPHVAGLALLLMGQEGALSPADLQARIVGLSIPNVLGNVPQGTVNNMIFNNAFNAAQIVA